MVGFFSIKRDTGGDAAGMRRFQILSQSFGQWGEWGGAEQVAETQIAFFH